MVNENYAYAYCIEDISKIENYDKAIADTTQTWVCHHRLEMQDEPFNSVEYLKSNNLYYHRPAAELIFLTRAEHTKLHSSGRRHSEESCRKISEAKKGRKFTEEHRRKLSESAKRQHRVGDNNPFFGKHHSEDTKQKLSESLKGQNIGTHWYNNGTINVCAYTCPEGFVKGRLTHG